MTNGWELIIDVAVVAMLIVGVGLFRTPDRARWGNLTAVAALACALAAVLYRYPVLSPGWVLAAFALGSLAGWGVAMRADMLQIPTMIAFQHGAGGLAACLVSYVELTRHATALTAVAVGAGIIALILGAATFSASMVASGKLARLLRQTPTVLPQHDGVLAGVSLSAVACGLIAGILGGSAAHGALLGAMVLSILVGVVFAVRVGGADMPVLISFLNAASGLCAALCGIIIQDRLLIACGATVAASGSILTHAMCKAMNRGLRNVFLGASGAPAAAATIHAKTGPPPEDAPADAPPTLEAPAAEKPPVDGFPRAIQVAREAQSVIIIPGYGMALAHAQGETVQFANRLARLGKKVRFVVHPIAGRMPGHMHVLLAEAEVDSDTLFEMDEINPEFKETDLAVVIGACDVVNPAAALVENTPISGMPILLAEQAKHVIVCNLDDRPGYSGVDNPLYTNPNTILLLGDAKASVQRLLEALNGETT
ncbi:MAG: NAD(P)(+) transhydrogenase (Re/Si-specific) subunit beta [Pirellulales bacterium]|nr:NAD(P)(+) transhydrogenase (Re/Si-specific) subunit beta [Pirellulales bacterium]